MKSVCKPNRLKAFGAILFSVLLLLTNAIPARAGSVNLTLVAFSTPQTAYASIIPAFQNTKAGSGVSFSQSYGASGDQANQVLNGFHADIVNLALEPDISLLVKKGIVRSSWYKNKYHGFVTDSVVVFVVRQGNPKHIKSWADLIKPGIDVITPNPFTSGGARWNVMAAYGAQIEQKKTKKQAIAYLTKLFGHVSVQDDSARKALATFAGGKGDVLLSYENEAIAGQKAGVSLDYVIPPQSILIENPAAVTTETTHVTQARAFLSFLYSSKAQRIFGMNGYRPVVSSVAKKFKFKNPKTLFTIRSLGSWSKVQPQFFDPKNGIMATVDAKASGS